MGRTTIDPLSASCYYDATRSILNMNYRAPFVLPEMREMHGLPLRLLSRMPGKTDRCRSSVLCMM
jgi:hypothetical protein